MTRTESSRRRNTPQHTVSTRMDSFLLRVPAEADDIRLASPLTNGAQCPCPSRPCLHSSTLAFPSSFLSSFNHQLISSTLHPCSSYPHHSVFPPLSFLPFLSPTSLSPLHCPPPALPVLPLPMRNSPPSVPCGAGCTVSLMVFSARLGCCT